jgi:hypothetical protein
MADDDRDVIEVLTHGQLSVGDRPHVVQPFLGGHRAGLPRHLGASRLASRTAMSSHEKGQLSH